MRAVKVYTSCGQSWVTDVNGTDQEIESYFLGKWFNIGTVDDHMVKVVRIEFIK